MATERQRTELQLKITRLVDEDFGGDWDRAFQHYAGEVGTEFCVVRGGLLKVLKDAAIGNFITRGAWADGVLKEVDDSRDGRISQQEFVAILGPPPAPEPLVDAAANSPATPPGEPTSSEGESMSSEGESTSSDTEEVPA